MGKRHVVKLVLEASKREASRRAKDEQRRRARSAGKAPPCSQPGKVSG